MDDHKNQPDRLLLPTDAELANQLVALCDPSGRPRMIVDQTDPALGLLLDPADGRCIAAISLSNPPSLLWLNDSGRAVASLRMVRGTPEMFLWDGAGEVLKIVRADGEVLKPPFVPSHLQN